mmetsp:Transcript_67861/g.167606  ORF Transcript_67861/g.167606 Transcript_67861/m.167606 type:complete len:211 (+) Transcript_67861:44-676(+)
MRSHADKERPHRGSADSVLGRRRGQANRSVPRSHRGSADLVLGRGRRHANRSILRSHRGSADSVLGRGRGHANRSATRRHRGSADLHGCAARSCSGLVPVLILTLGLARLLACLCLALDRGRHESLAPLKQRRALVALPPPPPKALLRHVRQASLDIDACPRDLRRILQPPGLHLCLHLPPKLRILLRRPSITLPHPVLAPLSRRLGLRL